MTTPAPRLSRRQVFKSGLMLLVASGLPPFLDVEAGIAEEYETDDFIVPPLPYAYDALEPAIDAKTMTLHHDKHFAAYTAKLNAAIAQLEQKPSPTGDGLRSILSQLSKVKDPGLRSALRNNGGGYLNHKMFFESMAPAPKSKDEQPPAGPLFDELAVQYGSLDGFKTAFAGAATSLFGSGFVWLVKEKTGTLAIRQYANQDHPCMDNDGGVALLGCDVWEHAYYLKYMNRRPEYVAAWWTVVNWGEVSRRYDAALEAAA